MNKILLVFGVGLILQSNQFGLCLSEQSSSSDTKLAIGADNVPAVEPSAIPSAVQIADSTLSNGIYLILRQGPDKSQLAPKDKNEQFLVYDERALEGDDKADVTYFIVQKEPFIPMTLAKDPTKGTDAKGKSMLHLQLAEAEVKRLEDFTRENVDKGVAIVIGGTVVSSHRIRVPIVGGKLQITRCTDNRCETIYTELQKDRKK